MNIGEVLILRIVNAMRKIFNNYCFPSIKITVVCVVQCVACKTPDYSVYHNTCSIITENWREKLEVEVQRAWEAGWQKLRLKNSTKRCSLSQKLSRKGHTYAPIWGMKKGPMKSTLCRTSPHHQQTAWTLSVWLWCQKICN